MSDHRNIRDGQSWVKEDEKEFLRDLSPRARQRVEILDSFFNGHEETYYCGGDPDVGTCSCVISRRTLLKELDILCRRDLHYPTPKPITSMIALTTRRNAGSTSYFALLPVINIVWDNKGTFFQASWLCVVLIIRLSGKASTSSYQRPR